MVLLDVEMGCFESVARNAGIQVVDMVVLNAQGEPVEGEPYLKVGTPF